MMQTGRAMKRLLFAMAVCFVAAIPARQFLDARQETAAPAPKAAPTQAPAPAPAPAQKAAVAVTQPAGYAGADTCALCHEAQATDLGHSRHGQTNDPRSPAATLGCESCHGPGQAHVDDEAKGHIKKFAALKPAEINATCLTCHNRGTHAGWEGSTHEARNLSCLTCHSVHKPASPEHQLAKATETATCATCHRLQVSKTERAVAHMPVREGKLSCSSCHNPHRSITNVKALKVGS